MKKNLLALSAIVFAIAVSSFTAKKDITQYLVYKTGVSVERSLSNYNKVSSEPATHPGTTSLNWFRMIEDDGTITVPEFNAQFDSYDQNMDAQLSDEAEIAGELDKR